MGGAGRRMRGLPRQRWGGVPGQEGAMRNRTVRCIDGVLPLAPAPFPAEQGVTQASERSR